jgi:hypothetical protein
MSHSVGNLYEWVALQQATELADDYYVGQEQV